MKRRGNSPILRGGNNAGCQKVVSNPRGLASSGRNRAACLTKKKRRKKVEEEIEPKELNRKDRMGKQRDVLH